MAELLRAQDPRSRALLLQQLMGNQQMGPVYGGAVEGASRAGSQILNALIAKQLMAADENQDFVKQAASRTLTNGMEPVHGIAKLLLGKKEDGQIDINAPTSTETVRAAGPAMDPATQQQFMSRALDPEQVLLMRLQQQQQANAPFNLGPNERRFQGGKEIAANIIPQKAETFKAGQTREFQRGGQKVTQEFDGKTWNDIAEGPAFAPDRGPTFNPTEVEKGLRSEFDNKTKDFVIVRDAVAKIQNVAANPSPAGDISLIFSYMKTLDPNSTVREGEYATAQNAGSIPTTVWARYNKAVNGESLTAQQRDDFVQQAFNVYDAQLNQYKNDLDRYTALAKGYNVKPENVVYDRTGNLKRPERKAAEENTQQPGKSQGNAKTDIMRWERDENGVPRQVPGL